MDSPAAEGIARLDLHGKNVYQARVMIEAALRRAPRASARIRLVHGSHQGTAIRDMVRAEYPAHPRVLRILAMGENETDLVLKEL